MKPIKRILILFLGCILFYTQGISSNGKDSKDLNLKSNQETKTKQKTRTPRIDYISLSKTQPLENDVHVIWFDDFDSEKQYMESHGKRDTGEHYGESGASMDAGFNKGDVSGRGNRKLAFADFPGNHPQIKPNQKFDEIYWRIYVKHERGWEGAPAKMSRATSIVSPHWQQAMILHVWSGPDNSITLDPASGVEGQTNRIKTTQYNDFKNLKWLGNRPASKFQITSTEESGYWVPVEAHVKLNTPGKSDGESQLWIDGRLEAERKNLNFRGSYTQHGINAVFLESYWNRGSPKTQGRWYDNFVVSTEPIGPVVCPANPTIYKMPYSGDGVLENWEVELASDYDGSDVVFKSKTLNKKENVTVNSTTGSFTGSLAGKKALEAGKTYYCRVRQKGSHQTWSDWSRWHQGFKVK